MNYKAIIKKQSTVIAIAVICLTIATIGVSYALFFQVETNSNNQVVTAGTLDVSYGSGSSSISATELVPMSDDEALSSGTMTGTIYIENTGTLPAAYEISLGNDLTSYTGDTAELLSHDYIRVAAYLNGELMVEPTTLSSLSASKENADMYNLFNGYLDVTGTGNSTMTVVLKVWITEDAPEDIIGDYVYLKMNVTSEVLETETISGTSSIALYGTTGNNLLDYKIYGNSVQNGDPLPTNEVAIENVGDLVTDSSDENYGKYKIPITVRGKNLWDKETSPLLIGNYQNSNNQINTYQEYVLTTSWQKVKAGTYTVSGNVNNFGFYLVKQTSDTTSVTNYYTGNVSNTFTLEEDSVISLQFNISGDNPADYYLDLYSSSLQLEEGAIATEYEEYKDPITTNIYLDEPLRKVGDCEDLTDCADYIDLSTSSVVRNVTYTEFDGTEAWSLPTIVMNGYSSYRLTDFFPRTPVTAFLSNYFPTTPNVHYYDYVENMATTYESTSQLIINVSNDIANSESQTSTTAWTSWLDTLYKAGNPLMVQYLLAENSSETIDLPNIKTLSGTTVIEVGTSTSPSNMTVLYY